LPADGRPVQTNPSTEAAPRDPVERRDAESAARTKSFQSVIGHGRDAEFPRLSAGCGCSSDHAVSGGEL